MKDLLLYFTILTWRSLKGLFLSYRVLGVKRYPSSVYFNVALMMPMFWDYQDLVGTKDSKSNETVIKISALMLLEDILLDELDIEPDRMEALFEDPFNFISRNDIELKAKTLLDEVEYSHMGIQSRLLKSLNKAQIEVEKNLPYAEMANVCKQKGLWFPAIAFQFNPTMDDKEIHALKLLGYWIKCVDDIVDINEDLIEKKCTIFNHAEFTERPNEYLEKLRMEIFRELRMLKYEDISRFIYRISISTYTFKLHNELLQIAPRIYNKVIRKYEPLLLINVVLASVLGFRQLLRIKPHN